MGTRSLTRVIEDGKTIITLYRQYDGYPSGHGKELADFLKDIRIVNGIGTNQTKVANGGGCLAAQLVCNFKKEPGGFYLFPTDTVDAGQEYEYDVVVDDKLVVINVYETSYENGRKLLFRSLPSKFDEDVQKYSEE